MALSNHSVAGCYSDSGVPFVRDRSMPAASGSLAAGEITVVPLWGGGNNVNLSEYSPLKNRLTPEDEAVLTDPPSHRIAAVF